MNKNSFASQIYIIFEDRNIKKEPSKQWLSALYEKIKNTSEEQFKTGLEKIYIISQEEWNKKYGFGGKPALIEWINFFTEKKIIDSEQQAILQVANIMKYASFYLGNDVLFDNEFTNEAVNRYGGIRRIAWDIDKENKSPRSREWLEKELKELWLACYDSNKGSSKISRGYSCVKKLNYVGDKKTCIALMNKEESKKLFLTGKVTGGNYAIK